MSVFQKKIKKAYFRAYIGWHSCMALLQQLIVVMTRCTFRFRPIGFPPYCLFSDVLQI